MNLQELLAGRQVFLGDGSMYESLRQAHGIRVIGGCCGTSPDHIRTIARVL